MRSEKREDQLETYLVGGAVRDELLGLPYEDRDWVVVGCTVERMLELGFTQVGRDFPVFLHPASHEEYALARTERKQGQGHRGFVVNAAPTVTLEQDLSRRDLTINAMAQAVGGEIVDPFGGQQDLVDLKLRHVSDAFSEDPLRVFRVARFAAQLPGFSVAQETLLLMQEMVARDELHSLSAERVWQECYKALTSKAPERFFSVLTSCGGLNFWLPELIGAASHFETESAKMRFAELGLSESEFKVIATRLKVSLDYLQGALDGLHWGESVKQWQHTPADSLADALDHLKVPHDLTRALWLAQRFGFGEADFAQFRQFCEGYAAVRLTTELVPGPAYGQALREARIAWLTQAR